VHDSFWGLVLYFDSDTYLTWSRIQGVLWTLADIVICFCLLRCANLCRAHLRMREHSVSFAVLWATVVLFCLLPFVPSGMAFFRLELAITVPHFALILYCLAVDHRVFYAAYLDLSESDRPQDGVSGPQSK
jgi:4-amino-4-deoxy-L-arabinose transferase-like glycosyltransferase